MIATKDNKSDTDVFNACVVDLCCGMGGLSVAAREMGMRVVAGVDLNQNVLKTFGRNFPEAEAIAKIQPDCALIENVTTVLAERP